ncbi:MAG: glycosyltransferase family 4 protein [Planctomycetaceae bacterium]
MTRVTSDVSNHSTPAEATAPELSALLVAGKFEVRGSSAYTLRLAELLPNLGIKTRLYCRDATVIEPARRDALGIRELTQMHTPVLGRLMLESARRELARQPPDLVHIQSWSAYSYGAWLARRLGRPFILSVHHSPPSGRIRFDRTWGRKIIAVSEALQSEIIARAPELADLVTVIHSGVEEPSDVPPTPVLEAGHVPVIGSAGPLETDKGIPYLLGAAQRVLAREPKVEFLIAGAGPEEGNLRRLARELGIDLSITFISSLPNFSASLAAMDIFCLPSLKQGLGTIMLQAMSLGRPVIATGVGGVYSVIRDNETGLVVPPADSARLADRILELLQDPIRARKLGAAGRQLVRDEFGVRAMLESTAALYREVVESAHAR